MTTIGTIELIASIDTSKYKKGVKDIDSENDKLESSTEKSTGKMSGSLTKVAKVGFGALIGAAVAAGAAIVANIDNAVKRIDTLSNSTRTFENLGFRTADVTKAMTALEKSIQGLPTSLDEGVRGVQLLAASTQDISKSQKIFSAINNAIIGFGGNAEDVSGVIRQFSQALAGGKIDAETYNSLLDNGLGPTLIAIGKILGKNTKQLKEGLSDGTITIDQFNDALLKLNTEGGGGMKSLEQIAKDSTAGISTSFSNMNTAITRGIANVINTIGAGNIANTITSIGTFFEQASKLVVIGVQVMQYAIGELLKILAPLIQYIQQNTTLVEVLQIAFLGIAAVLGGAVVVAVGAVIAVVFALSVAMQVIIGVVQFFMQSAINAFNTVKGAIAGFYNYFVGIVSQLRGDFSNVGQVIGNAFGNAFKGAINGVLRFVSNTINGFIDAINVAIDVINKVPGVKIGKLGRLPIPQLAQGGIVTSATLAMIGEGREPEAVIPLSKLDNMLSGNSGGGGSNVTVNLSLSGVMTSSKADERAVANRMGKLINETLKSKGVPQIEGL